MSSPAMPKLVMLMFSWAEFLKTDAFCCYWLSVGNKRDNILKEHLMAFQCRVSG